MSKKWPWARKMWQLLAKGQASIQVFFIALLYGKSVFDWASSVMLDACIDIVRTYIMITQMYVTPASVTGWKADARKTSCQHRGWSSAKAKQLSRGTSFFPPGFIMKYLEKDKFCSPYRGSPIGFFNPVVLTQDFEQSRNPEDYFWHPTSRAYFQSRIPPDFAVKSRIPSFK